MLSERQKNPMNFSFCFCRAPLYTFFFHRHVDYTHSHTLMYTDVNDYCYCSLITKPTQWASTMRARKKRPKRKMIKMRQKNKWFIEWFSFGLPINFDCLCAMFISSHFFGLSSFRCSIIARNGFSICGWIFIVLRFGRLAFIFYWFYCDCECPCVVFIIKTQEIAAAGFFSSSSFNINFLFNWIFLGCVFFLLFSAFYHWSKPSTFLLAVKRKWLAPLTCLNHNFS